jgi:hypothetical protein
MNRYRDISTNAPDYAPLPFYSSDTDVDEDLDLAAWLADTSAGAIADGVTLSTPGYVATDAEPVLEAVPDLPNSEAAGA